MFRAAGHALGGRREHHNHSGMSVPSSTLGSRMRAYEQELAVRSHPVSPWAIAPLTGRATGRRAIGQRRQAHPARRPYASANPSRMARRMSSARDSIPSFFIMRSW